MLVGSEGFARSWRAERLVAAPLIAPARQVVWPMRVPGEEDALARGALQLMVRPRVGGAFLATCALGFQDPSMPTGVFGCPREDEICAVSGGYGYVADTTEPERCAHVNLRPVVEVHEAVEAGMLVFVGFHGMVAWGMGALAWETRRLSFEGIRVVEWGAETVTGFGWDWKTDKDVEFVVDLRTGEHRGGV